MEITTMQMYWLVMLDSINIGSANMCVILAVCIFVMIMGAVVPDKCPTFVKVCTPFFVFFFLAAFASCVFLPSTKQMAAIMIVPKIVNNERCRRSATRFMTLPWNGWMS